MAVSAFRSTSRRGSSSWKGEESNKGGSRRGRAEDKAALPTRRSRSVSAALPRGGTTTTADNASASPISSSSSSAAKHFDNPLFASSHHPPTLTPPPPNATNTTLAPDDSRGRPMARTSASHSHSSSSAPRKCVGRSLSHARSRGRSPLRCCSPEVPFSFFLFFSHYIYVYIPSLSIFFVFYTSFLSIFSSLLFSL